MHTQKYIKSKLVVSRYDRFSVAGIRNVKEKKGQEFAKLDRAGIVGMTEENARFPRVDGFEGLNAARARHGIGNARILPPLPPSIDPEFLNGLIERRPFSQRGVTRAEEEVEQLERGEERLVEILLKRATTIGK